MRYNRRRRNRHRSDDDEYYSNNRLLLAEFEFHNKTTEVIKPKVLDELKEKLKTTESIFWTNKSFADHGIGFKIYKAIVSIKGKEKSYTEEYIRIIEYGSTIKFTQKAFNNCKSIVGRQLFIGFDLDSKQTEFLDGLNYNTPEKVMTINKTLMSWNDVINELIVGGHLNRYEREYEWTNFKSDVLSLFREDFEFIIKPNYKIDGGRYNQSEIEHIIKVIERRINEVNYRVAMVGVIGSYDADYKFRVISEKEKDYQQIDENAICIKINNNRYYLAPGLTETLSTGSIYINRNVFGIMSRNINDILGDSNVISPMIYNFYKDRGLKFEDSNRSINQKQIAINNQYCELLKQGRTIKFGDIVMNTTSIKMLTEGFDMDFDEKFLNVVEKFENVRRALNVKDARYNFNQIFDKLLQCSALNIVRQEYVREHNYKEFKQTEFKVNGMDIKVEKDSNRIKINGIFCRISDVYHILSKLICYHNVEDFNKYVKDVSHIGIEWKLMISNGVRLELDNPFYKVFTKTGQNIYDKIYMRFSLLWDSQSRNTVYLLLNNVKYKIRYKNKFKRYFNYPYRTIRMDTLKKELMECIDDIDNNAILEIVTNAIEEAKIIQARGKELVELTVKDIGAIEKTIDIKGIEMFGYEVKGRITGGLYFIDKQKLDVYKFTNGSWNRRCVVDDSNKNRIFEDKLANRLVNIHNEPKRVFTLFN